MHVLSKLESFPREILEEIGFCVALSSFLGPPTALSVFLRLSKTIHQTLTMELNPHLYARIFRSKFDIRAVTRRLGDDFAYVPEQASELVRRCKGLKRIRHNAYQYEICGEVQEDGLRVDMWMAYIMFLENDGNNAQQLKQYARIDRFALEFVRPGGMLHDRVWDNEGWIVNSEINALGMWLFWFTDNERVVLETYAEREEILGALGCLYAGSFKYASTYVPITCFLIPPVITPRHPPPLSILPLSVSPIPRPCIIPDHFGWELTLARPLLIPPVILSYIVRFEIRAREIETQTGGVPPGSSVPATRAEARRTGWTGATGEDYEAFRDINTKRVEWGGGENSMLHEQDWMRLRTCYDPWSQPPMRDRVYLPGMLDGIWEGKWLAVPPNYFQAILHAAEMHDPIPSPFQPPIFQTPMQFRLREHHHHNPDEILEFDDVGSDGVGSGALRAWLPSGIRMVERGTQLGIYDTHMQPLSTYQTFDPLQTVFDQDIAHTGPYGSGVWDIILTAETDPEFGEAWGTNRYVGRVRDWDGLVVLVREARANVGQWVFRGYVHGGQNLVGRWRETATQVDVPGWEGGWSMVKRG